MNHATQLLIEHLGKRPSPPQSKATKETFVKFAVKYSKWLLRLDVLKVEVEKANKPFSELSREEAESLVRDAEGVLRAEYYSDIREMAQSIKGEIADEYKGGKRGEELREWLYERISQELDSHHRIVYTWQAQKVLLFSDNSSAYVDNYGEEGIAEGGDINWNRLAFSAMEEDLKEQLEAEGVDLNDVDAHLIAEEEEESEDE